MNDIPEDVMKRAEKLLRNIEHEAEADHDYYLVWVRPMAVDAIARALMEERAALTGRVFGARQNAIGRRANKRTSSPEIEPMSANKTPETVSDQEWDAGDLHELHRMVPDLDAVLTHNPINQVYFRAGLLACREYMARFVEQGGDPAIAASIRANWWPSLGDDPGAPRQLAFSEVAIEREGGRIDEVPISPSVEALPRAHQFLAAAASPVEGR